MPPKKAIKKIKKVEKKVSFSNSSKKDDIDKLLLTNEVKPRVSVMAGLEGTSGPEDAAAASAQVNHEVNTCISMPISSGSIAGTY